MIRAASAADAPGIAAVHAKAWQVAYDGIVPASVLQSLTVEERTKMWAQAGLDGRPPDRPVLVAAVRDRIVGMTAGGPPRDRGMPFDAEIYAINIDPGCWRRGIGRALFLRCAETLVAAGAGSLYLWVFVANLRARHFYENLAGVALDGHTRNVDTDGPPVREIAYGWPKIPVPA
jgi:ribosomal protein S18 acetylase RimI-like enzyme